MLAPARMDLAGAALYRRHWRVAIVDRLHRGRAAGGDPVSMMLLMIPPIALYAVGVWPAGAFGGEPLWRREVWETG